MFKHVPLPSIQWINHHLPLKPVSANLWQDHGPDEPVHTSGSDDPHANYAVQPVRQTLVYAVTLAWWDERCDDQIDVAEQEENDHG